MMKAKCGRCRVSYPDRKEATACYRSHPQVIEYPALKVEDFIYDYALTPVQARRILEGVIR